MSEQKRIKITVLNREDGEEKEFETDCMLLILSDQRKGADGNEQVNVRCMQDLNGFYETTAICMKLSKVEREIKERLLEL